MLGCVLSGTTVQLQPVLVVFSIGGPTQYNTFQTFLVETVGNCSKRLCSIGLYGITCFQLIG